MPNDLHEDVRNLKNAVFGNPENPKETPGIISELAQMNTTLLEVRDSLRGVNRTIVLGFITALLALVFKGFGA